MKNIVLIGFMGSGKTSMGRFLSRELDYEFFDTDKELENVTGLKVNQIVKKYGKIRFASEERLIVKKLSAMENTIIATGGSFIDNEDNINALKENSTFVFLDVDDDVIVDRLKRRKVRPFTEKGSLCDLVPEIYGKRRPVYEKYADITVNTTEMTMEETAKEIMDRLPS
ncbi:MAG: shikimate kinase [Firmicutes bacterium]|nr:shikimate kinase [Bacillota bacterium]MBQ4093007.1 shikimate kinase [Bacillota bacterium]